MYNNTNKNEVAIIGTVASELNYSHCAGSEFYSGYIDVVRKSGVIDSIPFVVDESLKGLGFFIPGCRLCLKGQFRSYDERKQKKHKVFLLVSEAAVSLEKDSNSISLEGYVCTKPYYKEVSGIPIAEFMLANNQKCGKEFFLPCIAWYENATMVAKLDVGDKVSLYGRIQSRTYRKQTEEGAIYKKAVEVSICSVRCLEKNQQ